MKPVLLTIAPGQSCYEAALRMRRHAVHHLPVVGEGERLVGMVTDRDLRGFVFATLAAASPEAVVSMDDALREHRVSDLMSTPVVTTTPDDTLAHAVAVMAKRRIGSLPVVEDGRLVGILTETDLIRLLYRRRILCSADVESVLLPLAS